MKKQIISPFILALKAYNLTVEIHHGVTLKDHTQHIREKLRSQFKYNQPLWKM